MSATEHVHGSNVARVEYGEPARAAPAKPLTLELTTSRA